MMGWDVLCKRPGPQQVVLIFIFIALERVFDPVGLKGSVFAAWGSLRIENQALETRSASAARRCTPGFWAQTELRREGSARWAAEPRPCAGCNTAAVPPWPGAAGSWAPTAFPLIASSHAEQRPTDALRKGATLCQHPLLPLRARGAGLARARFQDVSPASSLHPSDGDKEASRGHTRPGQWILRHPSTD